MAKPAITTRQENAILALLAERSIGAAAKRANVAHRTLWRWLHDDPAFIKAYRAARREAVRQAAARLQQASAEAVDTLLAVLRDPDAPPGARVTAARAILEMALRAVELEDLADRVERLELTIIEGEAHEPETPRQAS